MVNYMYAITLAILLLSTLFVYFIGVRFTRPILEIKKAATSIAKGNLDINLKIKTNDTISFFGSTL